MLTTLRRYGSRPEAEVVRGRLQSAGVKAIVLADDAGGMEPPLALTLGVRLLVDEKDVAAAKRILEL